jgi:DNA-binding response OmpR family regulator
MKILICEDNQLAIRTLFYVLEKEGFSTETAEDGIKAITLLENNSYDLILMDIHLPFHSGLELIKYLRSNLKLNTPVLILSAFSDPQMQRQARELGISGYFVKPLKITDLLEKIRLTLESNQ